MIGPALPPAPSAHAAFQKNITRAGYFLDLHQGTQEGVGAPTLPRRELPRAAVVFAIGALDAFLSDWSAEVLIEHFEQGNAPGDSRTVLGQVQKELPTLAVEVALLPNQADRLVHVRDRIAEHFHERTSQHGAKSVSAAVMRVGASPQQFWQQLEAAWGSPVPSELDEWTNKRNRIIHRGENVSVTRKQARRCVELVETIGDAVDALT